MSTAYNYDVSDIFQYQRGRRPDGNSVLLDPFMAYSSTAVPQNIEHVLRLCEHVWLTNGQFKTAMQRIIRYFLTSIKIHGEISDEKKKEYTDFLKNDLKVFVSAALAGDDVMCYGNSFSMFFMPFNRMLICDKCSLTRPIDKVTGLTLSLESGKFTCDCPVCKAKTTNTHKDLRSTDAKRIRIVQLNPHEMQILCNFLTNDKEIYWQIPQDVIDNVKKSREMWLKTLPWDIIEAVRQKGMFKFKSEAICHLAEPTISGVKARGWGIPRMMTVWKDIYYTSVLKRFNEAYALDYIMAMRLLTPERSTAADPMMHIDMNMWSKTLQKMIDKHRHDPADWHTAPFPVKYQVLSGEGVKMSPHPLIQQGTADMMAGVGTPVDLFQGTLQLQAAPVALRLFEMMWTHLVEQFNEWLNWVVDRVRSVMSWEEFTVSLEPVPLADDIERKSILLQLMANQMISRETALGFFGIDGKEESKKMYAEQRESMEEQQEFEEDMQASQMRAGDQFAMQQEQQMMMAQQSGQAPAEGEMVPMGPPPMQTNTENMSPNEVMEMAQQMAQQFLGMDETTRRSQLLQLKQTNPQLHAQVRMEMQNIENQAKSQGVAQLRQQLQAQMGGAPM